MICFNMNRHLNVNMSQQLVFEAALHLLFTDRTHLFAYRTLYQELLLSLWAPRDDIMFFWACERVFLPYLTLTKRQDGRGVV